MHSQFTNSNRRSGLTRSETLWVVVLIAGIVLLIVNTLQAEVERGNQRMANDTLAFLASQLYLGLEARDLHSLEQLKLPYAGPGIIPTGLQSGERAPRPLQELLHDNAYLPDDPWGYSYLLVQGTADGHPALFVTSVGPDDELLLAPKPGDNLCKRVHLPPQAH